MRILMFSLFTTNTAQLDVQYRYDFVLPPLAAARRIRRLSPRASFRFKLKKRLRRAVKSKVFSELYFQHYFAERFIQQECQHKIAGAVSYIPGYTCNPPAESNTESAL